MKLLTGIALAASLVALPAFAATVSIPAGAGNAQSPTPLNYYGSGGSQVQQIYGANFFTGPTTITGLSFRAYPGATPSGFFSNTVSVSNLIVQLSNTGVSANENAGTQPSTTFANNFGANITTVYSGAATFTTAATGVGPQPFDYTLNFTTPFLYNPAAGNLLLDFLIPTGATVSGGGFGFLTFDSANTLNDGIRSIVNIAGTGPTGTLDTSGTITQFQVGAIGGAVPEPGTWAMMIFGFGALGMAMRRRRALAFA